MMTVALQDVRELLADAPALETMAQNMKTAGVADATERITQMVLELAKGE